MRKHKIASLILFFLLFGCRSVHPVSVPTLTPFPTNPPHPTETAEILPTSTTTPESTFPELTTTYMKNQIVISSFEPTIIRWLYWLKDGKTLLIGTQENGVTIFDVANKKVSLNFENGKIIQDLALSPDEKTLAVAIYATDSICLINPETGNLIETLDIPHYWPGGLTYSPDSKTLASANNRDGEIILWDIATGTEMKRLPKGDHNLGRLSFSPDGKSLIASSSTDYAFRVWDTDTWKLQRTFYGDYFSFSFNLNGNELILYSAGMIDKRTDVEKENSVWDFKSGKKLFNLSMIQSWTTAAAYDPAGKYIAVGGANGGNTTVVNAITIYDANTGKRLRELTMGYYAQAIALAFSPNGTQLASVSQKGNTGEVIIWDLSNP